MLIVENQKHYDAVQAYVRRHGLAEKLREQIDYLGSYACPADDPTQTLCMLYADGAPLSFGFLFLRRKREYATTKIAPEACQKEEVRQRCYAPWLNGGLIYYGPMEDGVGAPQFSVALAASQEPRWEVHT